MKISRKLIIFLLLLFLSGCIMLKNLDKNPQQLMEEPVSNELNYIDEHIKLKRSYSVVTVSNDMLYGSYVDSDNIYITYQHKNTGEIIQEFLLPMSAKEIYVQNLCVNNLGEIYVFAGNYLENQKYSWIIDASGVISEMESFALEDTDHARWVNLKGLKTDNSGNIYLWYEMAVPIVDSKKTGVESKNPIYTMVNRVYVKDSQLKPLFYVQTDNILNLELSASGQATIFFEDDGALFTQSINIKTKTLSKEPFNLTEGMQLSSNISDKFALTEDGFLFCMNGTVYKYDYTRKKCENLFALSTYGILLEDLLYIGVDGDYIEIVDNHYSTSELTRLHKGENTKQTITLGVMMVSEELEDIVADFNRYSTSSKVILQPYYDESKEYESGLEKLKLDLIRGEAPDIIELSSIDCAPFVDKGVLTDLYTFMENDGECNKENIVNSVLKAYEMNGHLYSIAPAFILHSMWGSQDNIGENAGLSLKELMTLLQTKGKTLDAIYGFSADEPVLTTLCTFGMNEFIDWEKKTCEFTGEYFKDMLQFAKEYNGGYSEGSFSQGIKKKEILLSVGIITSVTSHQIQSELMGDELIYIGYPTSMGSGTALSYHGNTLGINAASDNQESAWEFIRYFFLNGYSGTGFPVHKDLLATTMKEAMEVDMVTTEEGEYKLVKGTYYDDGSYIEILQAQQADVDKVMALINSADCRYEYNTDIMKIITEESEGYFSGQKTLDDVCEIIQRRVAIYMAEL